MAKLRRFVEEGGLILGNADCGKDDFAESFRELGKRMFPEYEFRELPAAHPIFVEPAVPRGQVEGTGRRRGPEQRLRELMLLLPTADAGRAWQEGAVRTREHLFQLASNIFLYAIDKRSNRRQGPDAPRRPTAASRRSGG